MEEREGRHETYMATQAHSALTRTWFYETHVDSQWPSHSESSPRQRALEAYRLVLYIVVALNRALRLRKSSEFQRVRQQGRSITSRLLILAWVPNEVGRLRIGFVVSKRISKLAVKRNRVKRLLSEAIRRHLSELPAGWDIVLSARNYITAADLPALEVEIVNLLHRARLLGPETEQTNV